jgi:hypothetical protein
MLSASHSLLGVAHGKKAPRLSVCIAVYHQYAASTSGTGPPHQTLALRVSFFYPGANGLLPLNEERKEKFNAEAAEHAERFCLKIRARKAD